MNLQEIVEQLQSCNYECEAGALENNVAFIELRRIAHTSDEGTACANCHSPVHAFQIPRLENDLATAQAQADSFARLLAKRLSTSVREHPRADVWRTAQAIDGDELATYEAAITYLITRGLAVRHESNQSWWRFVEANNA